MSQGGLEGEESISTAIGHSWEDSKLPCGLQIRENVWGRKRNGIKEAMESERRHGQREAQTHLGHKTSCVTK